MGDNESDEEFHDAVGDLTNKQANLNLDNDSDEYDKDDNSMHEEDEDVAVSQIDAEDVEDEEKVKQEETMTEAELLKNKETADKLKLEGNEFFKNNEADRAIETYTEGIKICPTTYTKERAVLYCNRAAAKIIIDSKKSAIDDCSKAIKLWPDYVRALLRRAKLYDQDSKYQEALDDYKRVFELDPSQPDCREAMVRLPPIIQEQNEKMKDEMISKLKDLGNMVLKPFGLSTSNFQMKQDPSTGSYSINFNQKP